MINILVVKEVRVPNQGDSDNGVETIIFGLFSKLGGTFCLLPRGQSVFGSASVFGTLGELATLL